MVFGSAFKIVQILDRNANNGFKHYESIENKVTDQKTDSEDEYSRVWAEFSFNRYF